MKSPGSTEDSQEAPAPSGAEAVAEEPATKAPEPEIDRELNPVVGQLLGGRYRVIERLAEGGMGTVYRAEHLGLHKEVAIKLVNESSGDRPDHALRFLREAMLTSRIDHPNVVTATDYGTFDDGTAFLAMTLVSGPTLASVMEVEKPMHWARAAEIGAQIADAITAAQAQGIVHRDLKPENLVLQPMPDGTDTVKVLDFGIAKYARDSLAPPAGRAAQKATRVGVVVGTPGYMAPEQAVGMRADHRADLYAMGVMLWECVVGKKLWDFDDMQRLMAAQLNRTPPSVRRASGDASIPDAFDELITALLATRPEQRPQSAAEVRDALRTLVKDAKGSGSGAPEGRKLLLMTVERPAVQLRGPATSAFRRRGTQPEPQSERTESSIEVDPPEFAALPERTGEAEANLRSLVTAQMEAFDPSKPDSDLESSRTNTVPARGKRKRAPQSWLIGSVLVVAAVAIALWPQARAPQAPRSLDASRTHAEVASTAGSIANPAAPPRTAPEAQKTQLPPAATPVTPPEPATPPAAPQEGATSAPEAPSPASATASKRDSLSASEAAGLAAQSADELRNDAREAFQQGDFRKAVNAYRFATKKAPTHAGAHAGLGASQLALGDAQGAIVAYRRAIELSPGTSGFHAALGRAYLLAGDRTRAIESYRKAVALDPTNQTAFAALAQLAPP